MSSRNSPSQDSQVLYSGMELLILTVVKNINHLQNFEVDLSTVRYGKIFSLPRLGYFRLSVEKFFRFVFVAKFRIFLQNFVKIFKKTKIFELRKFSSLGRISVPYRFISIFLRSKRNGSMDGRNFAGAYKIVHSAYCLLNLLKKA